MEATEFGKKILKLRKQKGMTQAKLAEMLNVSNKTISRWETGEGFPEISLLKPLASALGTTVDELLSEEEKEEEQTKESSKHRWFGFLGKSSTYEELPINVRALKEFVVDGLKSGKLLFVLYIFIMTWICIPAGASYDDVMNDVKCQLARAIVCKYLLVLGIATIVMFGVQIRQWRKGHLDLISAIGNCVALVVFGAGYFLSYRDRRNVGFWNCEYFSVNRQLMMRVTQMVLIMVLLVYLIAMIKDWKNKTKKLKNFWDSLVVFNKISFVCLAGYTVFILWKLCRSLMIYPLGDVLLIMNLMGLLAPYVLNVGVVSSLLGLVLGLVGVYQKQTKGSIFFAITCYAGRIVFAWAGVVLLNGFRYIFFH